MNLTDIGFTQQELQQKVIEHIASRVMEGTFADEDGDEFKTDSEFAKTLDAHVRKRVDETINALAEKHVLPNVSSYIENLTLEQTNKWGERVGRPVTFIEYLTQRAESYMTEQVNFEGKSKEEAGYGWSGSAAQTRIAHLIHRHLHYSIENAIRAALKDASSHIAKGIEETVKLKLGEVLKALTLEVKSR